MPVKDPIVHFSKAGSPYVLYKEILESEAGKEQIKKLKSINWGKARCQ